MFKDSLKTMKRKSISPFFLGLFTLTAIGVFVFYKYIHDREITYPSGLLTDYSDIKYYNINPETFQLDIQNEAISAFQLSPNMSSESISIDHIWVHSWTQDDYLGIASALHKFAWSQDADEWMINALSFGAICRDKVAGFISGEVIYFKRSNLPSVYDVHYTYILPEGHEAISGESQYRSPLLGWTSIHPENFKVNADEALDLAENNGGRDFRLALNNECTITIRFRPNPVNDGWLVGYYSNDGGTNFRLNINPYTGSYKILDSR